MNILDVGMMPAGDVPAQTAEAWLDLFQRRRVTFSGFCDLERVKGFLNPPVSLALPRGQESARLIMFRAIEEYVEAEDATERAHVLEELIDSINYVMALAFIDPEHDLVDDVSQYMECHSEWNGRHVDLLETFTSTLVRVTDKFRSRAWMVNAQDLYFAGANELRSSVELCMAMILPAFASWDEFWRFFVAKDNVLQFRLRTSY